MKHAQSGRFPTIPRYATFLLLALIVFGTFACASSPGSSGSAISPAPRFFWTLTAPSGARLSIQGTIHVGDSELYPLHKDVLSAMAESDLVYGELSLDSINEVQTLVVERMASSVAEPSKTVDRLLSPDELAQIETLMGKEMFRRLSPFQPWVCSVVLESYAASSTGLNEAYGVDMALLSAAGELGKEVFGLETASFQLSVLAGPSLSTQLAVLKDNLRELREEPDSLKLLYAAYRDNNQKALAKIMDQSMRRSAAFSAELAAYYDSLLRQRNQAWLERLLGFAQEGKDVFVFAGAAHFVGQDNLIDMLKAKGYKLSR